ncbi:MoaD/ThiS family protein [Formosa sp. S-31]|uniref:MoaD/ThiS family protein n=1 Tax=Formosa sp. S-31 TaxID=2790949 RepID=UPI003EBB3A5C
MITIKYFGMLAEQAKCQQEHLEFKELTLAELIEDIKTKHQFNSLSFNVALNQKLVQNSKDQKLKYNDEIALLPPFAGG